MTSMQGFDAVDGRKTKTSVGRADLKQPLKPTDKEVAIRRTGKQNIAAKYGFTDWDGAPDEALLEYQRFLITRMEAESDDQTV